MLQNNNNSSTNIRCSNEREKRNNFKVTSYRGFESIDQEMEKDIAIKWFARANRKLTTTSIEEPSNNF